MVARRMIDIKSRKNKAYTVLYTTYISRIENVLSYIYDEKPK